MLTKTVRQALNDSMLSDLSLFFGVLWHKILVELGVRPRPIQIETNPVRRRKIEQELLRVEQLLLEIDETADSDENEEIAGVTSVELTINLFKPETNNSPFDEPAAVPIREIRAKAALLARAAEYRARLGIAT